MLVVEKSLFIKNIIFSSYGDSFHVIGNIIVAYYCDKILFNGIMTSYSILKLCHITRI